MNKKFQVFVSSTYSDLKLERQACVEAILISYIPAGMELFSAGDETQLEIIKRWIDESDIYMLLLGGRYGSIEPKSGLSYTEIEYRYALEIGKPVFALTMSEDLVDEKVKKEGKEVLELNSPEKYKAFRSLVLTKISKFFNNLDQLKLAIIQSLLNIQTRYSLNGWVRSNDSVDSVTVLNQISTLTEKNEELERELDALKKVQPIQERDLKNFYTTEAKTLIKKISEDEQGTMIIYSSMTFQIRIGATSFPADRSARNIAKWEYAFTQLLDSGVIKLLNTSGNAEVYVITHYGFEVADNLKE